MTCLFAAISAIAFTALCTTAAVLGAPTAVLPFIIAVSIACPMFLAVELRPALAALSASTRAMSDLRAQLDALPETQHPLGL